MKKILAKKKNQKSSSRRGDTLIEIAFALVIIGFIISVAIHGAIKAHQASVSARKRTQATFLAQTQLELLRALSREYRRGVITGRTAGWGDNSSSDESTFIGALVERGMTTSGLCQPTAHFYLFPDGIDSGNSTISLSTSGADQQIIDSVIDDVISNSPPDWFGSSLANAPISALGQGGSIVGTLEELYATNYRGFTVSQTAQLIEGCPATPNADEVNAIAMVSWTDGNGHNQSVTQSNRISKDN